MRIQDPLGAFEVVDNGAGEFRWRTLGPRLDPAGPWSPSCCTPAEAIIAARQHHEAERARRLAEAVALYFAQRMSSAGLHMTCEALKIHGVTADEEGVVAYDGLRRRPIVLDRAGLPAHRKVWPAAMKIRPDGRQKPRRAGR